jgi:hypothetical protein
MMEWVFHKMNRPFNKTKRLWEVFFQFGKREEWTRVAFHGESFFPMHSRNYEIGVCIFIFISQLGKGVARDFLFMLLDEC